MLPPGMVNTSSSGCLPLRRGGAEHDLPADVGEGAADVDAAGEVDVADAQRGRLTPAHPGVGEHQDQKVPGSGFVGERADLAVGDYPASTGRRSPPLRCLDSRVSKRGLAR